MVKLNDVHSETKQTDRSSSVPEAGREAVRQNDSSSGQSVGNSENVASSEKISANLQLTSRGVLDGNAWVPIRLLLVEDNCDYARILSEVIVMAGGPAFEVVVAASLREALEKLRTSVLHVVLLDLSLPDSQGLDTFIRVHAAAPSVPTLIMSGVDDERVAMSAVQQGAQDYLLKGTFDGRALIRAVRYAIERRRADEALRHSEEQLKLALEAGNIGVWNWEATRDEIRFTGNLETVLGSPAETLNGACSNFEQRIHPDDLTAFRAALAKARSAKQDFSHEFRVIWPDSGVHWILARGRFYFGPDGAPARMTGALSDITERVNLEQQLFQSHKMEAIGKLAGGIAHDFNNLLTVILGRTELALREIDPSKPLYGKIDMVHSTAERAAALTRQLLAFSRSHVIEPQVIDLNAVVARMYEMLRRLIGEDIVLLSEAGPNLSRIKADPAQIEQVLINLVVNARDAMPLGGNLRIATENVEISEDFARGHVGLQTGAHVKLTVSDTGSGMSPEIQSHIFEPFFTTKPQGKGTGLGLSMVYGIAKQSGGSISVSSAPDRGTTFTLLLPITSDAPAAQAASSSLQTATRAETILLVEDELGVRELVGDVLRDAGYTILEAANAPRAIEVCEAFGGQIDLMLTDVVMPEMSGARLAELLGPTRPEMKILFMSGYTNSALGERGVLNAETNFLQKPFTHRQLQKKIRTVLDAR